MFVDIKSFQTRANMHSGIHETSLQNTIPKTHRSIIKHIIKTKCPNLKKPYCSWEKLTFYKFNQTLTLSTKDANDSKQLPNILKSLLKINAKTHMETV